MKRNLTVLMIAGVLVLSVCACGKKEAAPTEAASSTESTAAIEITLATEEAESEPETNVPESEIPEETSEEETTASESEEPFLFADLALVQFDFSSGAGAWATTMTIAADGSFSGVYNDSDMGDAGEGYPNGTVYRCDFSGRFDDLVKVNEYTYSTRILSMEYAKEFGTEEIIDGTLYVYSEAYGLEGAESILFYLPGAPLAELPEAFRGWIGYYNLENREEKELPFYALHNESQHYGFSSYNMIDNIKRSVAADAEWAAYLENSLINDPLNQAEMNETAYQIYRTWDASLNMVWSVLKQTKDAETMRTLTEKEREWIAFKEEEVAKAGAEFEGGSMQGMVMSMAAAELTKARVYELLELVD